MLDKSYQEGANIAFLEVYEKLASSNHLDHLQTWSVGRDFEKEAFVGAALGGLRALGAGGRAALSAGAKGGRWAAFKEPVGKAWQGYRNTAGGRSLRTLGWLTGMGKPMAGLSSKWVGGTLGWGLAGAAMAEEGNRLKGFAGGALGSLGMTAGFGMGQKLLGKSLAMSGGALAKTAPMQKAWSGLGKGTKNTYEIGDKTVKMTAAQRALERTGAGTKAVLGMGGGLVGAIGLGGVATTAGEDLVKGKSDKAVFPRFVHVDVRTGNNPFNPVRYR